MAITSALIESDDIIVANTDTLIQVTFPEIINPESFDHRDMNGDFIIDPTSRTTVTQLGPPNAIFTWIVKAETAKEDAELILDLSSISSTVPELGEGEAIRKINVIEKPDFQIFTHTEKTFALAQYFENPLEEPLIITEADNWTAPADSNITFESNSLKVSNPTESDFLSDLIGKNTFRDVAIKAKASNSAGFVEYDFVLRVNSGLPTIVGRC